MPFSRTAHGSRQRPEDPLCEASVDCETLISRDNPDALLLAILCDFKETDPQIIINRIVLRLHQLIGNDERQFREYISILEILSENRDLKQNLKEAENMLTQVKVENLPSYELGMEKGKAQGEKLGELRGEILGAKANSRLIAKNLLDILTDDLIAQKTGLSIEEVQALRMSQPIHPTNEASTMKTTPTDSLDLLNQRLLEFAQARDWEQFHSPKNLTMALAGECGELLEHFQWLTEKQSMQLSAEKKQEVSLEMADILIYLIRLGERLDIDLLAATRKKIEINEERFTISKQQDPQHRISIPPAFRIFKIWSNV